MSEVLEDLIKRRHSRTYGWRVAFEVKFQGRRADAIAISSEEVHGFEVKSCHWDLVKEFGTPEKSEPFRKHCNYWWLVCERDLMQGVDVPEGWGLLCPGDDDKLHPYVQAPHTEAEAIPIELAFGIFIAREKDIYRHRRDDKFSEMLLMASTDENAKYHLEAMEGRSWEDKWRIAHGLMSLE
jgi:hypothetical protein